MFYLTYKIFSSFSKLERRILIGALLICALSSFFIALNFYYSATKEQPAHGGIYTEGEIGQPTFINPLIANVSDIDLDLIEILFSNLLDLTDNYKISQDNKTWTVFLKKDLKWDDGKELTADDVLFTVKTIQDPDTRSPLSLNWQGIEVEKINDNEIRFVLKNPYNFFLDNLRNLKIVPQHIFGNIPTANLKLSRYNLEPVASGPYKFKSALTEKDGFIEEIVLETNSLYHKDAPFISSFILKFYRDEESLIEDFNTKKISGFGGLNPQNIDDIKINHNLFNLNLPRYYAIFLNSNTNSVLQNKEIRKALYLSVNREKIIKQVFKEHASIADGPIPSNIAGYNKSAYKDDSFSLSEAQQLLEKNNWLLNSEDGIRYKTVNKTRQKLEFEIIIPEIPFLVETADLIKEDWNKLGIKVNSVTLPLLDINKEVLKTRNYQMLIFGNILNNNPDVLPFWHSSERLYPGLNLSLYNNKEVDKILENIRQELSPEKRASELEKLQNAIHEDNPVIFLFNPNYIYVTDSNLSDFNLSFIATPAHRFENVGKWYLKTKRQFAN